MMSLPTCSQPWSDVSAAVRVTPDLLYSFCANAIIRLACCFLGQLLMLCSNVGCFCFCWVFLARLTFCLIKSHLMSHHITSGTEKKPAFCPFIFCPSLFWERFESMEHQCIVPTTTIHLSRLSLEVSHQICERKCLQQVQVRLVWNRDEQCRKEKEKGIGDRTKHQTHTQRHCERIPARPKI